jgi:hypothetical protein
VQMPMKKKNFCSRGLPKNSEEAAVRPPELD